MSAVGSDPQDIDFAPPHRGLRRNTAIGYGWAFILAIAGTVLSYSLSEEWNLQSLAPVMAGIVIMACFGGLGPTIACGVLGSIGWLAFVALDMRKLAPGHGLVWRWPDAPARFLQFAAMAIFISASYFARRRAEVLLRKAQQRLSVVLDESQIGTWHYDVKSGVFWLSPRMEAIFGLAEGATPAYSVFLENIPAQDRPAVINAMTSTLERRMNYEIEHRFVRNDGSIRRLVMRGKPFVGRTGKVERIIGVGIDVSEAESAIAKNAAMVSS